MQAGCGNAYCGATGVVQGTTHSQATPLLRVLLQQSSQQGLGLWPKCSWEADLLHEDELKEALMILVVEGQAATHHLVHDHAQPPPVHRTPVVIVLQHLEEQ